MRAKTEERTAFPWSVKEPLLKQTNGKCAHCGVLLDRYTNLSVDHVIPLNKGGTNEPENLTVLCEECNKLKSDMILPPMSWYPFLSVERRKALTKLLIKYMQETDYLAEDCLIPIDTFRIEVPITIKKRNKVIHMPAYIRGIRMERDDAFNWLMDYKRSLQWRDAAGTITHPSQFMAPCYLLKKGDIEVAMVNPWMIHEWDDDIKNYRNEILLDWYFHSSLPDRDYLPDMLAHMVYSVETYITTSIAKTMEGACMIMFRIRCFKSDRFCDSVFDRLHRGRNDDINEYETGHSLTARIRELSVFHMIGNRQACDVLKKKMQKKYPDGFMTMSDAMQESTNFNNRFESKE